MDRITRLIIEGIPEEVDSGIVLRRAYWKLVGMLAISAGDWRKAILAYVQDPIYVGRSQAEVKERCGRLINALSGGNMEGLTVDFTWKRFIEGLVALNAETLGVSIGAKRGRFKSEKVVRSYCHPKMDLLRIVNQEDNEVTEGSAGAALAQFFANTEKTATQEMEHVLLKILWLFFSAYKIDDAMWRKLITQYVNNPKNCPAMASRRSDKRHNIQSAIRRRKKISWKRFLEALKAIDVVSLECAFMVKVPGRPPVEYAFELDVSALTFRSNSDETE